METLNSPINFFNSKLKIVLSQEQAKCFKGGNFFIAEDDIDELLFAEEDLDGV